MKALGPLLAILTATSAGTGLTLALWRRSGTILAAELFGYSWLLGAGLVSLLLALAGTVLSGTALLAVVTVAMVPLGIYGIGLFRTKAVRIESGWAEAPVWEMWLGALALVPIGYMSWAVFRDAIMWDGLFIWEAKARHAFLSGGSLPASYFSDASRVQYHPSYPLYLPFTELWVYLWTGDCDQTAVKAVFPMFYAAAIALLWSGTRRLGGRPWMAALAALLPLFVPLMADHGLGLAQGYADLILGAVYLGGVSALLAWRVKGLPAGWPVAVACAAMLPWIKQEGLFLLASLVILAALMDWSRRSGEFRSRALGFCGSMLLFIAPGAFIAAGWRIALRMLHVQEANTFHPFTLENLLAGLPRLGTIFHSMGAHFAELKYWSLLWFTVPVALLTLAWQRRSEALWLGVALLAPLAFDVVPYLFTTLDLVFHVTTSLDRLYLQVSLVGVLALGVALRGRGESNQ